jgi:hypothetical protein
MREGLFHVFLFLLKRRVLKQENGLAKEFVVFPKGWAATQELYYENV